MDHQQYPEEVSLFERPCSNVAYQKIQYVEYRPTSDPSTGGPIEFVIPAMAAQYVNLKKTYLHVKVKIVKGDGTLPAQITAVAPANLVLHSMFSQVDVQLQQQLVSSSGSQVYGYKSYIETELEYGREAKEHQLRAQGYVKDQGGVMDRMDAFPGDDVFINEGFVHRYGWFSNDGRATDFEGPLMADICQQNRLILNGVEIRIRLWPAKDQFQLLSKVENADFKMVLEEATLKVCKVTPTPSLLLAHTAALKESSALYPYRKTQIKTFNIASGQYSFHTGDLFQSNTPTHLVVAMVSSKAFSGDYSLNPYNMKNYKLNSLAVRLDDESLPGKPLRMNFPAHNYISAYHMMFAGLNKAGEDWSNSITREEYPYGHAFFVYDLLPGDGKDHTPNLEATSVTVEGTFDEPLPENITVVILAKFAAMMEITESRSIII